MTNIECQFRAIDIFSEPLGRRYILLGIRYHLRRFIWLPLIKPIFKVSSVQEPCAKCFAVHILKFEILQTTGKIKQNSSEA